MKKNNIIFRRLTICLILVFSLTSWGSGSGEKVFAENDQGNRNPFEDIYETDEYYNAVLWAYYSQPQITNGMDETHFGPGLTVTRGQTVTFLWRSQGCPEPSSAGSNPFVDVPSTEYSYKPILWAVEKGITKGVDEKHFNPTDTLSTQHIVTFLYRTENPGMDGWNGEAEKWAADKSGKPFGVNIEINNNTDCPRANVVLFLYISKTKGNTIDPDNKTTEGNKVLVAYFSCTGTTESVAGLIADIMNADTYRIEAQNPYTEADRNYNNSDSRTSREQNDPAVRPAIAGTVKNLSSYDIVFLGYPIWWRQAPRILSTFVESCDFSNITVIPFCTSGSSDIGQSDDTLAEQAGGGNWLQGRRFSGGATKAEIQTWINEIRGDTNVENTLHLSVNDTEVSVAWEDNESVDALIELVASKPLTIKMSMYGGFEQVGSLGSNLPRNDAQMNTQAGDIVLYSGNQIVVFYDSNSWAYTRLGKISNKSVEEIADLLGNEDVTISISYGR